MSGLILTPAPTLGGGGSQISMTAPPERATLGVHSGDIGEVVARLRPAGKARFGAALVDVVATGEFLDKGTRVEITSINGSRVVVKRIEEAGEA